ncbi:Protein of unknown function DUF4612 [Cinara cedri]|uniref:Uncharacterized protein n=1 Tax=Cinara cedri TaxID=506608 RepID=A0A5E4MB91_9HEMI|nr:Protein of unknown function DUF4612 [Cinara cedri]
MGCGPSHFGISYSRKTKKKKNKHKESDDDKSDGSFYENHVEEQIQLTSTPSVNNLCDISEIDESNPLHQRVSGSQSSTSLFINPQLSSSQLNFFRMLDEKIEMGVDYKQTIEEQRLEKIHHTHALLMEWERVRIRNSPKPCSNPRSQFLCNLRQPHFRVSHSVVQFDQEQGAFHTELI